MSWWNIMIPHDLYFVGAGWVNEFLGVDSSRLLSYSTILAQVRTRRPEHLKHEEIQILLIKVLLSFHDLLDDVPKKNCCSRHNNVYNSTSAQELDQEGNDLWANFVEWCAFLGTSWHQRNLAWIWHPCPPGNGCYQKNGQDSEGKLRIKKDSFMCYKYIYNTWVTRTKRHMYSFLTITFSVALFVGWSSPLVTLTDEPWSPHFVG